MKKERLQKIISQHGVASRRKAERLIAAGKVKVNGQIAKIGDKANPDIDHITVSGKKLETRPEFRYIMLNKPRGVITTMKDNRGRRCVSSLTKNIDTRVYPIGRLDRNSEGLLLLTNDGEFANAIAHPSGNVNKVYRVTVRPSLNDEQMEEFRNGIVLKGRSSNEPDYKTAPTRLTEISRQPWLDDDNKVLGERIVLEVVLSEGRNRQIRRMFEYLGVEVARLRRISIGDVRLGMLPVGKWRDLEPNELQGLFKTVGLQQQRGGASYSSHSRSR